MTACLSLHHESLAPSSSLYQRFQDVRRFTAELCAPLVPEDYVLQSMPDASPTRWHLAHTTWFFETFFLARAMPGYRPYHPHYNYLFNSYYHGAGPQFSRAQRGLLSRPSVSEVFAYRDYVDWQMNVFLQEASLDDLDPALEAVLELGLHHEQQHQELILTDLKHAFSFNPLCPVYHKDTSAGRSTTSASPMDWAPFPKGLYEVGHPGDEFCFDNERPGHSVWLEPFRLATRLVTNAEYAAFLDDDGYRRPELWLSDGWNLLQQEGWNAPLYWRRHDDGWRHFTLSGLRPVDPNEPVCHVSYYEADAFARWAQARLPTEAEWEVAAESVEIAGNFVENAQFQPCAVEDALQWESPKLQQMFGDVWVWTASSYGPYPGYRPTEGVLGEYNGKFMCNQFVLRGGSCVTPASHMRRTYRNFFPPAARWQFTGIRLAR
jgi:ergothioneine biosynthesis protein EgtB